MFVFWCKAPVKGFALFLREPAALRVEEETMMHCRPFDLMMLRCHWVDIAPGVTSLVDEVVEIITRYNPVMVHSRLNNGRG